MQVTSTDWFCASCHINAEAVRTWKASPHKGTHCSDCHAPHDFVDKLYFKATTGVREAYINFLGTPNKKPGAGKPSDQNCVRCHPLEKVKKGTAALGVKFFHAKCPKGDSKNCATCHFNTAHVKPGMPARPPMKVCLDCHDNKQASRNCEVCHAKQAPPAGKTKVGPKNELTAASGWQCAACHLSGDVLDRLSPPPPPAVASGG